MTNQKTRLDDLSDGEIRVAFNVLLVGALLLMSVYFLWFSGTEAPDGDRESGIERTYRERACADLDHRLASMPVTTPWSVRRDVAHRSMDLGCPPRAR